VLFLSKSWPNVPILLLGFDSHADQPQHHQKGFYHDFADEKLALDAMVKRGGVSRCGA
jgi:hypothetical protein